MSDTEKLEIYANVLGEMAQNFNAISDPKSIEAGLLCLIAQSYVLEFAKHQLNGMEPFDALMATANGELEIPKSKTLLLKILTSKPEQ